MKRDSAQTWLERGLERYGAGDLTSALAAWAEALRADPRLPHAQEYIDYVRDNFDALTAQFAAAGVYDAEERADAAPLPPPPGDTLADGLAEVDAGLDSALDHEGLEVEADEDEGPSIEIEALAPDDDEPLDLAGPLDLAEPLPDHGEIEVRTRAKLPAQPDALAPTMQRPPVMTIQPRPLGDADRADVHRAPTVEAASVRPSEPHPVIVRRSTLPGAGAPPPTATAAPSRPRTPVAGSSGQRPIVTAQPASMRSSGQRPAVPVPSARSTLPGSGPRQPIATPAPPSSAPAPRPRAPSGPAVRSTPPSRSGPTPRYAPGYDLDELVEGRETGRRRAENDRPGLGPGFPDDLPTRERRVADSPKPARPADDFDEHELTSEFDDLRKTREHSPFRTEAPAKRPTSSPPTGSPAVIVDQDLLHELDGLGGPGPAAPAAGLVDDPLGADDSPLDLLNASLDRPARDPEVTADFKPRRDPAREAREERIRRRVSDRLREAQEAAEKGDFVAAVTAVEAAQKDDDEGAVAPVILHRHRDLLYRIYEGHIGDMTAVPLVAVPLHEISAHALDHRTGFLLSRIDGMLTFEDILDVAGMPRMEAYQILSNLLRRGVIEVRS